MKKLTTNISRLIIVSALFASAVVKAEQTAVKADQAEQPVIVVQVQTEVAKELTKVKANLLQDLQQQLTHSIKLQVNSAVSNMAESVKALIP